MTDPSVLGLREEKNGRRKKKRKKDLPFRLGPKEFVSVLKQWVKRREGKGREGKGREGKGREGKGRKGKERKGKETWDGV